jgi:hypothetical protein
MISLEDSLSRLVLDGLIAADEARIRSSRPDELESLLRGRRTQLLVALEPAAAIMASCDPSSPFAVFSRGKKPDPEGKHTSVLRYESKE